MLLQVSSARTLFIAQLLRDAGGLRNTYAAKFSIPPQGKFTCGSRLFLGSTSQCLRGARTHTHTCVLKKENRKKDVDRCKWLT